MKIMKLREKFIKNNKTALLSVYDDDDVGTGFTGENVSSLISAICSITISFVFSVLAPFRGDYIGLRKNPLWKEVLTKKSLHRMDRYVVFADIVNKANRANGKVMVNSDI